jgi:hypothetical protein
MHTAELLKPEPSCFEIEIGTKKLRRYVTNFDQISTESIQAASNMLPTT